MMVERHNARLRQQFGGSADAYVASKGHSTGSDLDRLVELAAPTGSDVAVDVATGGGHTALAVSARAGQVVATDLVPEMVQAASRFIRGRDVTNVRFAIADARALPFADGSANLVTCRIAPHHFSDVVGYTHEVSRVLRPGGRLVMIDSIGDDDPDLDAILDRVERWRDPTHVRSYQLERWREMLAAVDLAVDHVESFARTHVWDDWTTRSRMTADERTALETYFLSAPAAFQEKYAVTVGKDGRLESWADVKAIIRAVRVR